MCRFFYSGLRVVCVFWASGFIGSRLFVCVRVGVSLAVGWLVDRSEKLWFRTLLICFFFSFLFRSR